jgi:hypothetical protein
MNLADIGIAMYKLGEEGIFAIALCQMPMLRREKRYS